MKGFLKIPNENEPNAKRQQVLIFYSADSTVIGLIAFVTTIYDERSRIRLLFLS